jgi:hypothetical protein
MSDICGVTASEANLDEARAKRGLRCARLYVRVCSQARIRTMKCVPQIPIERTSTHLKKEVRSALCPLVAVGYQLPDCASKIFRSAVIIDMINCRLLLWPARQQLLTLLGVVPSIFKTSAELRLESLALRHQLGVLRRSVPKRLKLMSADRILWVWLRRAWADWKSALLIVKPETVVAWHRKGFRLFWSWKIRRGKPGRLLCRTRFVI